MRKDSWVGMAALGLAAFASVVSVIALGVSTARWATGRAMSACMGPTPPAAMAAPAPRVRPSPTVVIRVASEPPGFRVYRAGIAEPIGVTPLVMRVERDSPSFDIALKLEGYRSIVREITTENDRDLVLAPERLWPRHYVQDRDEE